MAAFLCKYVGYPDFAPGSPNIARQSMKEYYEDMPQITDNDASNTTVDPLKPVVLLILPALDDVAVLEALEARVSFAVTQLLLRQCKPTIMRPSFIHMITHNRKAAYHEALFSSLSTSRISYSSITVHKSQGSESDISVISLSCTMETLQNETEFAYGFQGLNVALSRARRKTIVILSAAQLEFLNACESKGFDLLQHLYQECVSRQSCHELSTDEVDLLLKMTTPKPESEG